MLRFIVYILYTCVVCCPLAFLRFHLFLGGERGSVEKEDEGVPRCRWRNAMQFGARPPASIGTLPSEPLSFYHFQPSSRAHLQQMLANL